VIDAGEIGSHLNVSSRRVEASKPQEVASNVNEATEPFQVFLKELNASANHWLEHNPDVNCI
jgi:hypothetical protein